MDINMSENIYKKISYCCKLNFDEWMKNDVDMTLWLQS